MKTISRQHSFILALLLSFALALVILRDGLSHITTHVFGGASGDGGLYLFLLQTSCKAAIPGHAFTLPAFYPYLGSLTWSDNYILPSCVAAPLLSFFSPTLVHNILLILATVLNGYCAFLLANSFGLSFVAALTALIAFEGFPFFAAHLGHAQLQWAFVLPLGVYFLRQLLADFNTRSSIYFGATLAAALLCSVYYFIFLLIITLITILFSPRAKFNLARESIALGAVVTPLLLFIPLLFSYLATKSTFGARMAHEITAFSANLYSYLSPTPNSQWYAFFSHSHEVETALFPGFVVLILAAVGMIRASLLLTVALAVVILSELPTFVAIQGQLTWIAVLLALYTAHRYRHPAAVLAGAFVIFAAIFSFGFKGGTGVFDFAYRYIPAMDGVRAVGRWGVVAALGFSLLAGFGINKAPKVAWILIPFLVWEVTPRTIGLEPLSAPPAVFSEVPRGATTLVLPLTATLTPSGGIEKYSDFAKRNTNAMNWGARAKVPVVNGYSGVRSRFLDELPSRTNDFSDPNFLTTIFGIDGLKYVVVTDTSYFKDPAPEVKELIVKTGDDGSILLKTPASIKLLGKIRFVGSAGTLLRFTITALRDRTTILFKGTKTEIPLGESKTFEHLFITRNNVPQAIELRTTQLVQVKKSYFAE